MRGILGDVIGRIKPMAILPTGSDSDLATIFLIGYVADVMLPGFNRLVPLHQLALRLHRSLFRPQIPHPEGRLGWRGGLMDAS